MKTSCARCLLDSHDDPFLKFDEEGVCSICRTYDKRIKNLPSEEEKPKVLNELVNEIKSAGKNNKYDCIIGISGGTDSTYVAYLSKKLGLRPLAVHLDNGWNSELAIMNIEKTLSVLDIDLFTYVIDWDEFKDLQLAYFKASVVDIEILTDHAIAAILQRVARKYGIRYILSGENFETEGVLPSSWVHIKMDHTNIIGIHKKYGNMPIKSFPLINYYRYIYSRRFYKVSFIPILNYVRYKKTEIQETIEKELGWKAYGGKHHESVFTRFYQSYILPTKFGIDKRKSHLSTLICARQLSKEDALIELEKPITDPNLIASDKQFVIKKWGLDTEEFDIIMNLPVRQHTDFPSIVHLRRKVKKLIKPSFLK
jgi:N-acetyl sugar amidotransferase